MRVIANGPVGCNNGCCDAAWLITLGRCKGSHDFSWFLYNYGWSAASVRLDEEVPVNVEPVAGVAVSA